VKHLVGGMLPAILGFRSRDGFPELKKSSSEFIPRSTASPGNCQDGKHNKLDEKWIIAFCIRVALSSTFTSIGHPVFSPLGDLMNTQELQSTSLSASGLRIATGSGAFWRSAKLSHTGSWAWEIQSRISGTVEESYRVLSFVHRMVCPDTKTSFSASSRRPTRFSRTNPDGYPRKVRVGGELTALCIRMLPQGHSPR